MTDKENTYLSEPMFYTLMALYSGEKCGTEIADFIRKKTCDRIRLGPGTLYTLLGNFLARRWIAELRSQGRKRIYGITKEGYQVYRAEIQRLKNCRRDAGE